MSKSVMRRACTRARGDERLSGRQQGEARGHSESQEFGHGEGHRRIAAPEKAARRHRSADLGRALRSVYDDTLRESVPDDFLDLLGKLS